MKSLWSRSSLCLLVVACLLLGISATGALAASRPNCTKQEKESLQKNLPLKIVLANLYATGCLGGEQAKGPATGRKAFLKPDLEQSERQQQGLKSLDLLLEEGERLLKKQEDSSLQSLLGKIGEARTLLVMERMGSTILKPGYWDFQWDDNRLPGPEIGPDPGYRDPACKGEPSGACKDSYEKAKNFLSFSYAAWRVTDYLNRPILTSVHAHLETLDKQWDSYFNEARSQFPWELLLNGYLYGRKIADERGLQAPPESQLILLHPSPALEYVSAADDGSRFEPAVVIELLGYNRWSWNGGRQKNPWGGSLIASVSDRAGVDNWGYGGMVHYKNTFSLGVSSRDGDLGVFVSVDLGKWINKYSEKTRNAYQRGLSLWDAWF